MLLAGIEFVGRVLALAVHRRDEAADGVDFAVHDGDAHVVEAPWQHGATAPGVLGDVVFLVIGAGDAEHAAADHMDFFADRRQRHLVERRRHRRLLGPAALRVGGGRDRGRDGGNGYNSQ